MNTKIILFLLLNIVKVICFAQSVQKYSGNYTTSASTSLSGKATYYYYEDSSYERVFHGPFTFKNEEYTINGNFKNGKKDGRWLTSGYIFDPNSLKYYKETAEIDYRNGKMNGKAKYSKVDVKTGAVIIESYCNFKNNKIIGDLHYKRNDFNSNFTILLNTDTLGLLNGDFKLTHKKDRINFEDIRKYQNGKLTFRLHRNVSNGDILWRFQDNRLITENYEFSRYNFDWSIYIGLDFWFCVDNNQYCGCNSNPIYLITVGINDEGYNLNYDHF